ncbi:Gfo/Idh/MocA family protein [Deinococcus gobiensis]|uniref:Oxidoreductase domain protein n=1 Tax=Deinococcus gobiensis (strain DSM 21396 / JCM 16679 / CGMCC 1.7299 / I-0) TaxID=745776 RepID=H8H0G0_DEIGI|nr:Gfo/Idh/MocA family oxidoreductase [Deinococcus gobiensis]AFD27212.1 Oxidoreductase domain protein [Deinococcus gobiensis I-0]
MTRKLRWGLVGGGVDAFIGAVHRHAAALDGQYDLVAGALSSTPERSQISGQVLGLPEDRVYNSWEQMLERERMRPDPVEVVSIVTPNHMHFPVALAAVQAGFHVICDKPLVHTSEQARALEAAVRESGTLFAVTYNYSGYPLIRQAREMVLAGAIGEVRKVQVEYHQGWLAREDQGKQAAWRTDPALSGPAGALGDIGTHAEQLLSYVTGQDITSLSAELTSFVPGRAVDDDANVRLRLSGGARGLLTCSQVEIGRENDLRLSVFGTLGSLGWCQEDPNVLIFDRLDQPRQILTRGGPGLGQSAQAATRLPAGHPEAFVEAFGNIYRDFAAHVRAQIAGKAHSPAYPTIADGVRGVEFVEAAIESASSGSWVNLPR